MFERSERHIRHLEMRFGRERLLRIIAGIHIDELSQHVDHYRAIIRTGQWLNEDRPTHFSTFCSEFERSSIAYINVGFDVFNFLGDRTNWALEKLYRRVAASEALRGQFGKRSPSGLDQRLDRGIDKLKSSWLKYFGDDEIDDKIVMLCTPTKPWLSAEAMMLEDFAALRKSFSTSPSIDKIIMADAERQEVAWTFLRRHSRWSVKCMQHYYTNFDTPLFDEWLANARQQRKAQAMLRRNFVLNISNSISSEATNEIMVIANEITYLNQLNLAFEPCFSFKGGPGVAHGLIFKEAADSGLDMQNAHDQLKKDKWDLIFTPMTEERNGRS